MTQKLISPLRALFALMLIFVAAPVAASSGAWTVSQKSGHVEVLRTGVGPASLQVNASLKVGDTIVTGRDGRAMLTRGNDYVLMSANSRLSIPRESRADGFTRIKQWFGSVFYDVETTGKPHFEVETPVLAAVVKGTQFTITVHADRASVHVTRGLVGVSSVDRLASRDVEAGMVATVNLDNGHTIDLAPAAEVSLDRESDPMLRVKNSKPSVDSIDNAADETVADTVEDVASVVDDVVDESVADTVEDVTSVVDDVVEENVADTVEDVTSVVDDVVDETVADTVEDVTSVVDDVVDETVADTVEDVTSVVDDVVDETVADTVEDVTSVVDDVVDETVADTVEDVISVVDDVVDETVADTVEDVISVVDDVVDETVADTVEDVTSVVDDVVGDTVEDTVGGLLGGLPF